MRRHSLAARLARHWVLFALVLALLFAGTTLLSLFVLEDSFIDRRLHAIAAAIDTAPAAPLPAGYAVVADADAAGEIRQRSAGLRVGAIAEFRLADGRYLHVLRLPARAGEPRLLVFDATDELTVTTGVIRAAPYLLALMLTLAAVALALSIRFVRGTARRAADLVALIRTGADPSALRRHADGERVLELAEFARLIADAWEQRLAALQRERETLAFLAHELRTPLQSARTSLALLDDPGHRANATLRLQRAIDRLVRAGNAVLWLSSEADPQREHTALRPLLDALAEAFAPLAAGRGQEVTIACDPALHWRGPHDVLEAMLGNLLLNAIQHGGRGTIAVDAASCAVSVTNPRGASTAPGFGVGLQLVARLGERCGWRVRHVPETDRITHRIECDAAADASG